MTEHRVGQRYGGRAHETSNAQRIFAYETFRSRCVPRPVPYLVHKTQSLVRRVVQDAYDVYALLHMWFPRALA